MNLRRTLVLLAASAATLTMGSEAVAAPEESGQRPHRVLDLDLRGTDVRAAAEGASLFTGVSPLRVMDTRSGIGVRPGPVPGRGSITLDLSTRVPEGTTAVVLNLTGVTPTMATHVTVWPAELDRPGVSSLNLAAGEFRANGVTVALGPSRSVNLYNHNGSINLVADLAGYYTPDAGALYKTRSPQRVLDTRTSGGAIPARGSITVDTSRFLPDPGATAVTVNLTVVNPTANTYLTAWPTGSSRPNASSINVTRGTTTANQVTVALGPDKDIRLYNHSGSAHVIVDLVGDYDTDSGDAFYAVTPTRLFDTRTDGEPLQGGFSYGFALTEDPSSPDAQISALVLNVTGTGGTAATYLTLFPGGFPKPSASSINLAARQTAANQSTTGLGWDSDSAGAYYGFSVYNNAGFIDVVLDLNGFFAPL